MVMGGGRIFWTTDRIFANRFSDGEFLDSNFSPEFILGKELDMEIKPLFYFVCVAGGGTLLGLQALSPIWLITLLRLGYTRVDPKVLHPMF